MQSQAQALVDNKKLLLRTKKYNVKRLVLVLISAFCSHFPGCIVVVSYSLMGRRLCSVLPPFDQTEGSANSQQVSHTIFLVRFFLGPNCKIMLVLCFWKQNCVLQACRFKEKCVQNICNNQVAIQRKIKRDRILRTLSLNDTINRYTVKRHIVHD